MPVHGVETGPENFNPVATIASQRLRENARYEALEVSLAEMLPVANEIERCNAVFVAANRPDLAITQPASMITVDSLDEFLRPHNFGSYLQVYTGFQSVPKVNSLGSQYEDSVPIPVNREQLASAFRNEFNIDDLTILDFPVFHRMGILFFDYTAELVKTLSAPENRHRLYQFPAELFAAYQIMSRLVDTYDPYVMQDGVVNEHYVLR